MGVGRRKRYRPGVRLARWLIDERVVISVIILNSIALFMMQAMDPSVRPLWFYLDYACVMFFAVEQIIKRYGISYVSSRAVLLFDIAGQLFFQRKRQSLANFRRAFYRDRCIDSEDMGGRTQDG